MGVKNRLKHFPTFSHFFTVLKNNFSHLKTQKVFSSDMQQRLYGEIAEYAQISHNLFSSFPGSISFRVFNNFYPFKTVLNSFC